MEPAVQFKHTDIYTALFDNLREIALIECSCEDPGKQHLVAPLFHEDQCRFKIISEEGFRQAIEKEVTNNVETKKQNGSKQAEPKKVQILLPM